MVAVVNNGREQPSHLSINQSVKFI